MNVAPAGRLVTITARSPQRRPAGPASDAHNIALADYPGACNAICAPAIGADERHHPASHRDHASPTMGDEPFEPAQLQQFYEP